MDNKEQKKKAEEIKKILKVKKEYKNNSTEAILEEVYKKHMYNNERKEDR